MSVSWSLLFADSPVDSLVVVLFDNEGALSFPSVVVVVVCFLQRLFPGSGRERGGVGGFGPLHGVHGGRGQGVLAALPHRLPEVWIEGKVVVFPLSTTARCLLSLPLPPPSPPHSLDS